MYINFIFVGISVTEVEKAREKLLVYNMVLLTTAVSGVVNHQAYLKYVYDQKYISKISLPCPKYIIKYDSRD